MGNRNKDAPKKEKPVKEKSIKEKVEKEKKPKKDKVGAKVEHELSDLAKSLSIRVSSPYGYYPDDVDPIIIGLQKSVSELTKENTQLSKQVHELEEENRDALSQISKLKMEMSLIQMSAPSQEDSLSAIGAMFGDDPDIDIEPPSTSKPKIKIKNKT